MRIDLITPSHLDELTDLVNRNCDLDAGRFTPDLLYRRLWASPFILPEAVLGAFQGDRLVAAMIGGLRYQEGFVRLFAVERQYRRRGLASSLLTRLEDLVRQKGAAEMAILHPSPGYFTPGLDPRYTAALCMLHRCGYERSNVVVNMVVPLDQRLRDFAAEAQEAERHIAAQGLIIRRAGRGDQPAMRAWMQHHFPGGWEMEVDLTFDNVDPIPTWIALRNATVVGFAVYDVEMFPGGFGPTGVEESVRGLGLGRALMLRTLADMHTRGYTECEIAWVGPVAFYANVCDARINRVFWQMRKNLT